MIFYYIQLNQYLLVERTAVCGLRWVRILVCLVSVSEDASGGDGLDALALSSGSELWPLPLQKIKKKIGSCKTVKMGICWFFKLGFSGLTFLEWQTCQFLYCLVSLSMMTVFSNLFISNFIFVIYKWFSRSRQLGGLVPVL